MTYVGVIASAVLHVGGLFLLLSARAPEPLVQLGNDTRVAVDIISVDEYNALVSRAPSPTTLAALRTQPEVPRVPVVADANPVADTPDTPPDSPARPVELAMRPPPPPDDALPEAQEPEAPESDVAVAPMPEPLELDAAALQDRGVDPADLGPPEDPQVAMAPPAPKPPRGAMDAMPEIDTSTDEPPKPAETEGEGQEAAPEPQAAPEEPVEVAEAPDDLAPMVTPLPVPKPRGSLAMASDAERAPAPAQIAEAPPEPAAPPETPPEPTSQLSEAELEEERRMMEEFKEFLLTQLPPSEADQRVKEEEEANRAAAVEQERLAELAALDDAERRRREAEDQEQRRRREAEQDAERRARALADIRDREIQQQLRAEQEAARREAENDRRRAAIEAQRLAQQQLDDQRREAARVAEEARQLAIRRQRLAALDAGSAPEARANAVLNAPAPQDNSYATGTSALDRMLAAAGTAASAASTGPMFSASSGSRGGASLTQGEQQAVLDQLRRCWRVDTFSANARNSVVTFRVSLRQNGFIDRGSVALLSPNPPPPEFQIAVDRARMALQDERCQPFSLPPEKYNAWRDITITFDPAQMVLQ